MTFDDSLDPRLKRFAAARCCWFSSVRPGGRPHSVPVWHVWVDSRVWVVTKSTSVKTRNLQLNSSVTLTLPDPMQVFILEGQARIVPASPPSVRAIFIEKYDWDIETDQDYDTAIEVEPQKIFGWDDLGKFRWSAFET